MEGQWDGQGEFQLLLAEGEGRKGYMRSTGCKGHSGSGTNSQWSGWPHGRGPTSNGLNHAGNHGSLSYRAGGDVIHAANPLEVRRSRGQGVRSIASWRRAVAGSQRLFGARGAKLYFIPRRLSGHGRLHLLRSFQVIMIINQKYSDNGDRH